MSISKLLPFAQRLIGKVALVTGGSSGIGLAAAKHLHRHGAKVVIADVQDDGGRQACREMMENTGDEDSAMYVHCDVGVESDVARAVDAAMERYGKLDIMFSNVGISETTVSARTVVEYDTSTFERIMHVNVVGMFLAAKHAARVMIPAKRGGAILFTASCASLQAGLGGHGYCTSKHAVVGLTKSMATDLGRHGIRVNSISPFLVFTPGAESLSGLGRSEVENWGRQFTNLREVPPPTVDDVAESVLFLVSDDSKHITGHNLVVDEGYNASDSVCNAFRLTKLG